MFVCKSAVGPDGEGGEEDGRRFVEAAGRVEADVPEENAAVEDGEAGFVAVFFGPAAHNLSVVVEFRFGHLCVFFCGAIGQVYDVGDGSEEHDAGDV